MISGERENTPHGHIVVTINIIIDPGQSMNCLSITSAHITDYAVYTPTEQTWEGAAQYNHRIDLTTKQL